MLKHRLRRIERDKQTCGRLQRPEERVTALEVRLVNTAASESAADRFINLKGENGCSSTACNR